MAALETGAQDGGHFLLGRNWRLFYCWSNLGGEDRANVQKPFQAPRGSIRFRGPQPRIMLTLHPAPKMTKVGVGSKAVISPRIQEMRLVNAS